MVTTVVNDSPAKIAGITEGDIIVSFNGSPIRGIDDLHKLLVDKQVGIKTLVKVLRRTEIITLDIIPDELVR